MNRIKYISVFTVTMIVLTVLVSFVASLFNADISSRFWIVPLYFWIFYSVAILLFNGKANQANSFMLFKGTKMLATMVVLFALAFTMRSPWAIYPSEIISPARAYSNPVMVSSQ